MLKTIWHWFFCDWSNWVTVESRKWGYMNWFIQQTRICHVCNKIDSRSKIK